MNFVRNLIGNLNTFLFLIIVILLCNFLILKVSFVFEDSVLSTIKYNNYIIAFLFLVTLLFCSFLIDFLSRLFYEMDEKEMSRIVKEKYENIRFLIGFILVVGHIMFYFFYYRYQNNLLVEDGIYTKTIVTDNKIEKRGRMGDRENYIYYKFQYKGQEYSYSASEDSVTKGDSILIKFLPNDPYTHLVLKIKKTATNKRDRCTTL